MIDHQFGINGLALKWFDSYLRGRAQSVIILSHNSDEKQLLCGVTQGSVFGPVLLRCIHIHLKILF